MWRSAWKREADICIVRMSPMSRALQLPMSRNINSMPSRLAPVFQLYATSRFFRESGYCLKRAGSVVELPTAGK